MRVLVVAHERDTVTLRDWAFEGDTWLLSTSLFPHEEHDFEFVRYHSTLEGTLLLRQEGDPLNPRQVVEQYSTLVLLSGHHARTSTPLFEFLSSFLDVDPSQPARNPALVMLDIGRHADNRLAALPGSRVFQLPEAEDPSGSSNRLELWWDTQSEELSALLTAIEENQTPNPNVGFGLLLLNSEGEFFLMQRLRQPGRNRFGTIGGSFSRGYSIRTQLNDVLARRFRQETKVDLGPLMACTTMKNDFYHYVDLTFLATTARQTLGGVSDPQLRPLDENLVAQIPGRVEERQRTRLRYTFTLREMAWFYENGHLFAPVANAFESLCRHIMSHEARNGIAERLSVPALFARESNLEIPWASHERSIRQFMSNMSEWSNTSLPFFEGSL